MNQIKSFISKEWIKYTIFWAWNLIFSLTLITVQTQDAFLFDIIGDVWHGLIPLSIAFASAILLLFPIFSIVLGLKVLKNDPVKLINYFYGVQAPILLLCILRLAIFRELNLTTGIIIYSVVVSIVYYFLGIIKPSEGTNILKMGMHTLLALVGIYTGLLLLFIVVPTISFLLQGSVEMLKHLVNHPIQVLQVSLIGFMFFLFFTLTATLFIIAPFALIYYYLRAFYMAFKNYQSKFKFAPLIVAFFIIIYLSVIYFTSTNQPQKLAFELGNKESFHLTDKKVILANREKVRAGFLNAYLAPYRYVDTWHGMRFIGEMYKGAFKLDSNATGIQNLFNGLMYPFLYQDVKEANYDMKRAEELYENIFDIPIQRAEREAIKKALSATYDRDMANAGILNIDERKILITHQDITINETANAAEVTLHERYLNQTFDQLELFYYFRLPDNAAVTGLWLSNDDSLNKKFNYKVSPRGAAQKIYNQEVERKVDPSLLEQVGPHQYRLRAFPIMPKTKEFKLRNSYDIINGAPFHIWLKYVVLKTADNKIPALKLLEKRNVYWGAETHRNTSANLDWSNNEWMPTINGEKPFAAVSSQEVIKIDTNIALTASNEFKPIVKALKLAILLDESFSMEKYKAQLISNVEYLNNATPKINYEIFTRNANNKLDLIKVSDINDITNFGVEHSAQLLSCFTQNKLIRNYDAIIVLTDEGSYELDNSRLAIIKSPKPIIICHINGSEAPAYSDNLFETIIASNGTAVVNLEQAISYLYRISNTALVHENQIVWKNSSKEELKLDLDNQMIKPIAAQKYIQILMQQASGQSLSENKNLDLIHKIAVQNSIVTPYSSMIVLVDEEQWKRLKEAEESQDRFNRINENGKEQLTKPFGFGLMEATGTPEPHEWILLFLVGSVLLYTIYQKRIS